MRRRKNKTLPVKKILIFTFGAVFAGGAFYLFLVGLLSLISFVPQITTNPETEVVEPVVEVASVNTIEKSAFGKNIIFERINESSKSAIIIAKIKEGPEVYFSKSKEADFQMDSLQLILSKLTIDNKKPSLIDMRYTRPIVKY